MTRVSRHIGVPAGAKRLIWNVFFTQTGRGVDFAAHLPFADAKDTRSVVIDDHDGQTRSLAALVMRPAPQVGVAMIGFVCVDPGARNQGLAKTLVAAANGMLDEAGFAATLLWTSKPRVYEGAGYRIIGRDRFLTVTLRGEASAALTTFSAAPWPDGGKMAGLPAFATSAERFESDRAAAVVAYAPRGVTLLDWTGDPTDVAALLGSAGVVHWSVNLASEDSFDAALDPFRFSIVEQSGAFTMARYADPSFVIDDVPLSDRI